MSENKGLIEEHPDYLGSIAASGGAMSEALLEGNWNVDPDEAEKRAIPIDAARSVFTNDPAKNGDLWITVDLADVGTDNLVALAWNGFHVIDIKTLSQSRPVENANAVRAFALKHGVGHSHIIYDATSARYFNDYIQEAIPYISAMKSYGMYKFEAMTIKDMCYLRLCRMIKSGSLTIDESVANSVYAHINLKYKITVETEFIDETSVVHFNEMASGRKRLDTKKEMNRRLGHGRSMDLLDPCAMRMLPCAALEYGSELDAGAADVLHSEEVDGELVQSIYDETLWC